MVPSQNEDQANIAGSPSSVATATMRRLARRERRSMRGRESIDSDMDAASLQTSLLFCCIYTAPCQDRDTCRRSGLLENKALKTRAVVDASRTSGRECRDVATSQCLLITLLRPRHLVLLIHNPSVCDQDGEGGPDRETASPDLARRDRAAGGRLFEHRLGVAKRRGTEPHRGPEHGIECSERCGREPHDLRCGIAQGSPGRHEGRLRDGQPGLDPVDLDRLIGDPRDPDRAGRPGRRVPVGRYEESPGARGQGPRRRGRSEVRRQHPDRDRPDGQQRGHPAVPRISPGRASR